MNKTRQTAKDFVLGGYKVFLSVNGGVVVVPVVPEYSYAGPDHTAAFSNPSDFLAWITEGHIAAWKDRG